MRPSKVRFRQLLRNAVYHDSFNTVLDVGSGERKFQSYFFTDEYIPVDLPVEAQYLDLDFRCDLIVATHVISHIENSVGKKLFIKNLIRLCDGRLVFNCNRTEWELIQYDVLSSFRNVDITPYRNKLSRISERLLGHRAIPIVTSLEKLPFGDMLFIDAAEKYPDA